MIHFRRPLLLSELFNGLKEIALQTKIECRRLERLQQSLSDSPTQH